MGEVMEEAWMEKDPFELPLDYRSELLVQFGFIKPDKKAEYQYNEQKKMWERADGRSVNKDDADEQEIEVTYRNVHGKTGFPNASKTYRLAWEVPDLSLEEPYYWLLEALREAFTVIEKLEDSFSAAENSAFFGVTQQRLGAQQDKISQLLATVGKMIKELFQMVRELRILDERLHYYRQAQEQMSKPISERSKNAEITLKGIFVDLVQQGAKSAASVFGMARELEFITLPDLFFDAPPMETDAELTRHVESLKADFNENVLRVLRRHLNQYIEWRRRTFKEHETRKRFMRAYLKQHFDIIQMYISWLKPYLRHIARLSGKERGTMSPEIVSAFEGSLLDIELLCQGKPEEIPGSGKKVYGCILATYHYRTRPELKVVQEGYQRGPVHIGKIEVQLRVYGWTDEKVNAYKMLKRRETFVLLGEISSSVKKAMDSLGDELNQYLTESDEDFKRKEEKQEPEGKKTVMERFFGDFYTPKHQKQIREPSGDGSGSEKGQRRSPKSQSHLRKEAEAIKEAEAKAANDVYIICWNIYKNFKKAHKLLQW